jgi:hypothetical protein
VTFLFDWEANGLLEVFGKREPFYLSFKAQQPAK